MVCRPVQAFPKDAKIMLLCGDGLRSLVASKTLQDEGGFTNLVWIYDGLMTCEDEEAITSQGTTMEVGYKNACLDSGIG